MRGGEGNLKSDWMKALKEKGETKRVYIVCTYVPVSVYTTPWDMGTTEGGASTVISAAEISTENDTASVSGFL